MSGRHSRRRLSFAALAALLAAVLAGKPAAAARPLSGAGGFAGVVRAGSWAPITFELEPQSSVAAHFVVAEVAGRRFRSRLGSPPPRRAELVVFIGGEAEKVSLRLEDAAFGLLADGELPLHFVAPTSELWGEVESPGQFPGGEEDTVGGVVRVHLDRNHLPADWRAYEALDRLRMPMDAVLALAEPQRAALRRWLVSGGTLELRGVDPWREAELADDLFSACVRRAGGWRCGAGRIATTAEPPAGRAGGIERVTRNWLARVALASPSAGASAALTLFAAAWCATLCAVLWPRRRSAAGGERTGRRLVRDLVAVALASLVACYLGLLPQGRRLGMSELRVILAWPGSSSAQALSRTLWQLPEPGRFELASGLGAVLLAAPPGVGEQRATDGQAPHATTFERGQWSGAAATASGWVPVRWSSGGLMRGPSRSGETASCPPATGSPVPPLAASLREALAANGVAVRAVCLDPVADPAWTASGHGERGPVSELVVVLAEGD